MKKVEEPAPPRSTIFDRPDGLKITIPVRRNVFMIGFLGFWLLAWLAGEIFALVALTSGGIGPESLFLVGWLGAWTVGGMFAWYAWLNQVAGKEIIRVDGSSISLSGRVARFERAKSYRLVDVGLRWAPSSLNPGDPSSAFQYFGISGGTIAFDYGAKTVRFGAGLDEPEANQIVSAIRQRFRVAD